VRIVYRTACAGRSDALKKEHAVKQLSRAQKQALIATCKAGRKKKL
jgi:predicted GIY-YIG superfamily endonuclease